ncbi:MAG: hypothetical protein AAB036_06740 [Elusimicrobiota bacterium]
MAMIRAAALGALIYLTIVVCYPDGIGTAYHVFVPSLIASGALGVWLIHKTFDLSEVAAKFMVEAAFLVTVAAFVGFTMPQRSGKTPFQQWADGARPTRSTARRGLRRLGLDPDGVAGGILRLLPDR